MKAIFFDCDGVLVDTERDGHRVAFNRAFAEEGLDVHWNVQLYGELLRVAGGKERMREYFDRFGWPTTAETERDEFISRLHKKKTDSFMEIVESREMEVRPGVLRLIDQAAEAGIRMLVCSTSNARSVEAIVHHLLGREREKAIEAVLAGDVVDKKKPAPDIYELALRRTQERAQHCVVIEDSRNGLLAATQAGLPCIVTTSSYTTDEDHSEARLVVPDLENRGEPVSLSVLEKIIQGHAKREA